MSNQRQQNPKQAQSAAQKAKQSNQGYNKNNQPSDSYRGQASQKPASDRF